MTIKNFFIISAIIGLLIPAVTHAQIKINEVMYDPAGSDTKREWIEIYNASTQSIDLSTWYLQENNTFHKLVAMRGSILPAGSYAILADSIPEVLADYANYIGLIFDSVFSLNNTGETISIANPQKELIDTLTYSSDMGANNDGNSLQINNGTLITAGPTFGTVNKTQAEPPVVDIKDPVASTSTSKTATSTTSTSSSSTDSTHSEQESVSNYVPIADFKVGAGRDRVVSINTPIDFEAYLSKSDIRPRYTWNLGDFDIDSGKKINHTYKHIGTYEVVLEGRTRDYIGISRTEVKVIEPQLDIATSTLSISVHNKSKQEINIGGFVFNFKKDSFIAPRNTIVTGGGTITLDVASSTVLQSFCYPNGEIYQQFDTI
jgi:hypothetical protein